MSVIECSKLIKSYGKTKAINQLDLGLDENKIIGLIGRNGAGKTTFLRMCAGLILPSSGVLKINGEKPFNNLKVLNDVVLAREEFDFDSSYKIKDVLDIASIHYVNWEQALADELLTLFKLDKNKKIKKLSKGMKTMMSSVIALSSRCALTLFDEPTAGLDAAHRKEFYNIIIKEFSQYPRTFIISSHLLSEIETILEEIVLIDEGQLILHDDIDVIRDYGLELEGPTEILEQLIMGKTVYNRQDIMGKTKVIIKKDNIHDKDYLYIEDNNIQKYSVNTQDMCIYLAEKGVI